MILSKSQASTVLASRFMALQHNEHNNSKKTENIRLVNTEVPDESGVQPRLRAHSAKEGKGR